MGVEGTCEFETSIVHLALGVAVLVQVGLHLQSCVRFLRFVLIVCHWLRVLLLSVPDGSQFFQKLRSKATRLFATSLLAPPDGSQLFPEFWSKVTRLSVTSLTQHACMIDIFLALSWTLLLEGPNLVKSPKKEGFNFHEIRTLSFLLGKSYVYEMRIFHQIRTLQQEGPNLVKSAVFQKKNAPF